MKSRLFRGLIIAACACLFALDVPAWSADGWEAALKVKAEGAESKLSFGQRVDAGSGIDGRYDVPAMLSGPLSVYFLIGQQQFWRDIRSMAFGRTQIWTLRVENESPGQTVALAWAQEDLPRWARVKLFDLVGQVQLDMRRQGRYVFTSGESPREFQIILRSRSKKRR